MARASLEPHGTAVDSGSSAGRKKRKPSGDATQIAFIEWLIKWILFGHLKERSIAAHRVVSEP